MDVIACILSFLCLLLNMTLFIRLKPPNSFYFVIFQLTANSLSPVLILFGATGAVLGWFSQSWVAVAAGGVGVIISVVYMQLVTIPQKGFDTAFGQNWEEHIPPTRNTGLLSYRWQIGLPGVPEPIFKQNVPFWTIPGTNRELLCDIWQPPQGVERSGMAIIYLHGSAWTILDKDYGTRTMFRQLAAQGHVVMDVAYRLIPEVDIYGMTGDVKRAVDWMKSHAAEYGINPQRIVLAGGSAGGHLALLAAYSTAEDRLIPEELKGKDLTVHAVVSLYGPIDLKACYTHLDQKRVIGMPKMEIGRPDSLTMKKSMADAGRLDALLGGHLHEVPDMYALGSPLTHVSRTSPPTLLIQGVLDVITPVSAAYELEARLAGNKVPVVNIVFPLTNHAFDLLWPQISPAAQSALFAMERFLALMEN